MSTRARLLALAEKHYLSPTDETIDDCLRFIEKAKDDIDLLNKISLTSEIHYVVPECLFKQKTLELVNKKFGEEIEKKEVLDSLLKHNAVISIKKIS